MDLLVLLRVLDKRLSSEAGIQNELYDIVVHEFLFRNRQNGSTLSTFRAYNLRIRLLSDHTFQLYQFERDETGGSGIMRNVRGQIEFVSNKRSTEFDLDVPKTHSDFLKALELVLHGCTSCRFEGLTDSDRKPEIMSIEISERSSVKFVVGQINLKLNGGYTSWLDVFN